jgi:uracil permease
LKTKVLNEKTDTKQRDHPFRYALDKWPPAGAALVLGLQWVVVLVPGLLVLGDVVGAAQGLNAGERVAFLQRLLLLCALVQVGQVLAGHRLPGLVGPSAVLMVGVLSTAQAGMPAIYGAMAVGGGFMALVGFSSLASRLGRLFTPPVLATTLVLIAVTLAPTMRDLMFHPGTKGGGAASFGFAVLLVCAMFWAQHRLKGLLSSAMLLIGLVAGAVIYHAAGLGLSPGGGLPHLAAFAFPSPFPHRLSFEPAVITAFCLCYLAVMSNELATVEALGVLIKAPQMPPRLGRALGMGGLGGIAAGIMGVPGPVTYSVSPAVVISSHSASRFALLPAAVLVALLALWPGGLAVFQLVPPPVVGAVLLYLMAGTVFAALGMLTNQECGVSWNQGIVVGAAMVAGLCLAFMPPEVKRDLPPALRPLLANGFVVGLALALLLEHVLLKDKDKRRS